MYHIGQQVVCVRGAVTPKGDTLKEGKTYTIKGVNTCLCAGALNVGIIVRAKSYTTCSDCGARIGSYSEWWHNANRFVPLEEYKNQDEQIAELLKESEILLVNTKLENHDR